MFHLRKTTCSLLLIAGLNLPLIGQTMEKNDTNAKQAQITADGNKKALTADQKQALLMLEPLFVAANELEFGFNTVYLRAQIADTMWEYDEARARRLFKETLHNTISRQPKKPAYEPFKLSGLEGQIRGNIVERIAERDPAWANQIALQYLNKSGQIKPDMWMLKCLASTDPQRAAQIMKQVLKRKEAIWLSDILTILRYKDAPLADDLFSYALTVGPQDTFTPLEEFLGLSIYVFPHSEDSENSDMTSPLNTDLIKQYFAFGYKALMTEARNTEQESRKEPSIGERAANSYMYVIKMLPFFDKYMPDAAPEILARWEQVLLRFKDGKEHMRQVNLLFRPQSSQELLNNAEQAKDEFEKQALYIMAIKKYLSEANFDQALPLMSKLDDEQRPGREEEIHVAAAKFAIARGNIDTAYLHSRKVEFLRYRIDFLCQVVRLLQDNKEPDKALEIINETEKSIEKEENGPDKVVILLMVANAAARLKPARGFEIMKSAIEAINRARRSDGTYTVAIGYDNFDENLRLLAKTDFTRSLELAKSIKLKDGLIAAQVAACRGVLLENESEMKR
jgi:hypothetical protein